MRAGAGSWTRGSSKEEGCPCWRKHLWVYCALEGMMHMVLKAGMMVEVECVTERARAWASSIRAQAPVVLEEDRCPSPPEDSVIANI